MSVSAITDDYQERVLPRPGAFLPLLLVPPIALLTFLPFMDLGGLWIGLGIVGLALVGIWFGSPVIEVDAQGLSVNDIELPHRNIGSVEVISAAQAFEERGPKLSPAAFTRFQASVKSMVKVTVLDDSDPTPYWLFSTRNPEALKQALEQSRVKP